jgi:glycosyltransferase involved in cell wall biosynthesis
MQMLSNNQRITVGITCYNEGDWLLECWNSVLSQTDDRWEAVLVMDGTTHERTQQIFDQIEHPRLRKYRMPTNVGLSLTRNKAFELAKTDYLFCLDGDDQLIAESVAIVLRTAHMNPKAGYIYGNFEYFDGGSGIRHAPETFTGADFIEKQPIPSSSVYKKETWEKLGGFAPELTRGNMDYDFLIGALEAGIYGVHCGQVFYRYRWGSHPRLSTSYQCRYHETHEIIVKRHPVFFARPQFRKRFLAVAYWRAARANIIAGYEMKASELAWMALRNGMWQNRNVWALALRGKLPFWVYDTLRLIWQLLNGISLRLRKGLKNDVVNNL